MIFKLYSQKYKEYTDDWVFFILCNSMSCQNYPKCEIFQHHVLKQLTQVEKGVLI